jgi:crotonobetainyl-CoA:carnitine CoA-transferase CaiB-like acyl-CoA transferase
MRGPAETRSYLPLSGMRVLEIADGVAGPYAAKLLGDLGAEVIKLEPTRGDSARTLGPFPDGKIDPERSGMFVYLNAGKRRRILDQEQSTHQATCRSLAASVDVLIESFPAGERDQHGLDITALRRLNAALVLVSVTPFGQTGPRAAWRGNDLIAFHSSGFAFGFPALEADNRCLPPLNAPTYAAEFLAGQVAATAAMHGVLVAQQTGVGCHLDVSLQEAVAAANNSQFNRIRKGPDGLVKRTFSDKPTNSVVALLPCADGWVAISPREEHQWSRWLDVMGRPAWSAERRFGDRASRDRHWSELYPLLADWSRSRTKTEVFQAAQEQRVACLPLGTALDLLDSPQLASREFFVMLEDPETAVPGRPYHLHLADRCEEAAPPPFTPAEHRLRPLEGVRVVDFSWVLTGPICTRYLASLGAEVIKIESAARADLSSRDLSWQELNPSKRSITLNFKHERARELARELIARSDVVVENFSTGVMERLGLDYARLEQVNPRIVVASSSAFGRTGPDRDQVAYGTLVQCLTGWAALSAYPGYPPRSAGSVWTDPLTAVFETLLILAAIRRQRATGQGALIDLSMAEATIAALPEPILAWSLAHEVLQPRGNRHPVHAPQGCYPTLGEDRWIALSIQSNTDWDTLCRLMQRADLLADARFGTPAGRRVHHDALDGELAAWSIGFDAEVLAQTLQANGIAATATLHPEDVAMDTHLHARSFLGQVERVDGGGTFTSAATPWVIDGYRPHALDRPPTLGQDNGYIFKSVLGLDAAEYDRLTQEQVIY